MGGATASKLLQHAGLGLVLLALGGCIERYMPEVINAPNRYLVVDGFINGNGRTRIKLSRTVNLSVTTAPPAERGASVQVVDNTGLRYMLREQSAGLYVSDSLVLPVGRQYLLRISTASSEAATYESASTPLKVTPPFDKLDWTTSAGELQIRVSTHDASAQSRYYRWRYVETWHFRSGFESLIEYRDGIIKDRITPIYNCWRTEIGSLVKQTSTAQLSQDVITDYPLLSFPDKAERVKIRYSVLVSQYAETAEEFAYWELLRKNTEAVGTINDPLPVQLTGNVHRVGRPTEPVLGFVGAHTTQQQRLFISRQDLPLASDYEFENPYFQCSTGEEIPGGRPPDDYHVPETRIFQEPNSVPISYIKNAAGTVIEGYTGSTRACVDCRVRGTTTKPAFW